MIKSLYKILFIILCFNFSVISQTKPLSILSEYIKIKSVSGNEKPAALYMKKLCEDFGFYTTVFSDTDSSYNFCASLVPLEKNLPAVLFINHIDVVPVDEKGNWKHPAFSGVIDNDTLYGRGTLDMKGLAVMQVFALKKIKENQKLDE